MNNPHLPWAIANIESDDPWRIVNRSIVNNKGQVLVENISIYEAAIIVESVNLGKDLQ